MNAKTKSLLLLAAALLLLSAGVAVLAQSSAGFNLEWNVLGGGGGVSSSADFRVASTAGQGLAGPPSSASSSFQVTSGFWVFPPGSTVYLPVVFRS